MGNIKENLKAMLGMKHGNRFTITAEQARAKSLFGSEGYRDKFICDKIEEFSRKIEDAAAYKKFAIVEKLSNDYDGVVPEIIEYFKGKGFGVYQITSDLIPELFDDKYLVIAWKDIKKNEELPTSEPGNGENGMDL